MKTSKGLKEVLLFSGGMDSLIAWAYLKKPKCLYFPLNNRAVAREQEVAKQMYFEGMDIDVCDVFDFSQIEKDDAEIPLRNLYLILYASNFADKIWIAVQKGEKNISDRTQKFFIDTSRYLFNLTDRKIRIDTPFWHMTKADMIAWYLKEKLPLSWLTNTWSCYNPVKLDNLFMPCGHCSACFRRWVAMEYNGIEEDYVNPPQEGPLVQDYIFKMERGEYDKDRTKQTITVLRRFGRL